MVAPAEPVRAVGEHAQRSQVAPEHQPDELQHQEQGDEHDLQLLDEPRPQPVHRLGRSHLAVERPVFHAARGHGERAIDHVDRGDIREPVRRFELVGLVLCDHLCTALVGPHEAVGLPLYDLALEHLADRLVIAQDGLVGHQRREECERLLQFPLVPRGGLGHAFREQQRGLYAAAENDGEPHRRHQPGDDSPARPEAKYAQDFHLSLVRSLTSVVLKNAR